MLRIARGLQRVCWVLESVTKAVEFGLLAVLVATVFGSVVIRYLGLFTRSFDWVDEFSRFLFIWLAFLGATIASREAKHIRIDVLVEQLSPRTRALLGVLVDIGMIYFLIVLAVQGWQVTQQTSAQTSPSLGWSMSYVYASLPINAVIMLVYAVSGIVERQRAD
jgi:TRAP-type transport system small permease protein